MGAQLMCPKSGIFILGRKVGILDIFLQLYYLSTLQSILYDNHLIDKFPKETNAL